MRAPLRAVTTGMSRCQTKRSDREGHEARRMGQEGMRLDEHLHSHPREREASVEGHPALVPNLLNMVV